MLIHPLPANYLIATGETSVISVCHRTYDCIRLTCWFPDKTGYMEVQGGSNDDDDPLDDFYENTCKDCKYYFDDYIDYDCDGETEDSDGNPSTSITYRSACPCYHEGIESVDFPCSQGYDEPDSKQVCVDAEGWLPPMAYAVNVVARNGICYKTYAWMQGVDSDHQLMTHKFRTLNTFDDHSICWGSENSTPDSLPELVNTYCDAPANADLLSPREYIQHRNQVRATSRAMSTSIDGCVIAPGFDAALLVSITEQRNAYLLLRGSGCRAVDGVIAAGLQRHTLHRDGEDLEGFITAADSHDRCWFLLPHPGQLEDSQLQWQALLLGQIPNPYPPSSSCSSLAPSSSEPAALAAS